MTDPSYTDRRTYLAATAGLTAGMAGLAGCLGDATGTLATQVTDQPGDIADFEQCVVTIEGMWLGPAETAADDNETTDEETATSADREYHEYDEPQTADLVQLQGEETQLVDERDLETDEYAYLQLDVSDTQGVLTNGTETSVEVPGQAPLTFNHAFEIREDTRTTFTADFTPVQRGAAGGYILQPVAQGITVTYEDS